MRNNLLLVFGLLLVLAPFAASQDSAPTILHLETTLNHVWDTHDTATAARLIADDFRGISSSGHPLTKADMLNAIKSNEEGATEVAEENVRISSNTAIYTALVTDRIKKPHGTQSIVRTRVTDIWQHRHNRWVLIASQETIAKD